MNVDAKTKLTFLLAGGGIGAILALLFAPKPGVSLRHDVADVARRGAGQTRNAAQQLKQQAATYYDSARSKAGDLYHTAQELPAKAREAWERSAQPVNAALEAGQEAYKKATSASEAKAQAKG